MLGFSQTRRVRARSRRGARVAGLALAGGLAAAAGADPVHFPGNGHYYEVVVSPNIGWLAARNAASARGGYLASITSAEENAFILGLVLDTPDAWYVLQNRRAIGPWLGGYQPAGIRPASDDWEWVSGEAWSYTNWSAGQPDNDDTGESFVHFSNLGTALDGTWNDRAENDANRDTGYVVEFNENPCAVINRQPTSKSVCPGQRVVFSAGLASVNPLSYQWYFNGSPVQNGAKYFGARTNRLIVRDAQDADEGVYFCLIQGTCSPMATDFANLNVAVPGDLTGSDDPSSPAYGVPDGIADSKDGTYFIQQFEARNASVVDLSGSSDPNDSAYGIPDGLIDASDYFYFLDQVVRGCPEPPNEGLDESSPTPGTDPDGPLAAPAIITQVPAASAAPEADAGEGSGQSPFLIQRPIKREVKGTGGTITGKSQREKNRTRK